MFKQMQKLVKAWPLPLALISLILSQAMYPAETYYLDAVNGSDTNPGTSAAPWKTLAKTQSVVLGGDTVLIRDGSYGDFTDNVARNDWVTYKADEGHHPEFQTIHLGRSVEEKYDGYLRFDGIKVKILKPGVRTFSIIVDHVNYVEFLNCYIYNFNRHLNYRVRLYGNNIRFHRCEVFHDEPSDLVPYSFQPAGNRGIEIVGENFKITNNYIHDFTASGIYVTGKSYGLIENNHIGPRHSNWPGMTPRDYYHGSLISLEMRGSITIRRNIIHGGARLLNIYGGAGKVNNLIVENNLFYDAATGEMIRNTNEARLGDGCKFNHNTIIAKWENYPPDKDFSRYASAFAMPFDGSYSGDFEFYNNLIIGEVSNYVSVATWTTDTAYEVNDWVKSGYYGYDCIQAHISNSTNQPGTGSEWRNYWRFPGRTWKAGGNIVFAYLNPSGTQKNYHWNTLPDSTILCSNDYGHKWHWKGEGWDPEKDFFIAAPDLCFRGTCHRLADFRLKPDSPPVNYGNVEKAIAAGKSLGTLGPDGFIRDDGILRDENYHSAGCYEYILYDDVSENDTISTMKLP
jgi:hypothetical protein